MGRSVGYSIPKDKKKPSFSERLTPSERKHILNAKRRGAANHVLAKEFGVSLGTMNNCVRHLYGLESQGAMPKLPEKSPVAKILAIGGAKSAITAIAKQNNVTPQQAAIAWMSVLDKMAAEGMIALQRKYDPKYEGIDDLHLGYKQVGGYQLSGDDKSAWMRYAIAEEDWSAKEVAQLMMMQAKTWMDLMPYSHPKLAAVEPIKRDSELEKMTPEERRKRLKELGKEIGLKISEDES